ncbi:Lrp/AsnC family transcriptional regulator [Brevibacterium paucivorans]
MERPTRTSLEDLDSALTRLLQEDGRARVHDLADKLGVSRDVVARRMKALRAEGGWRIVAALDPAFAGHRIFVHAAVEIDGPTAPIAQAIADMDETVLVSLVSGSRPVIFESRHPDYEAVHETLDRVRSLPGVRQVRTSTYSRIIKGFFMAEETSYIEPDKIDVALIRLLQDDGRRSFRSLATAVHLSPTAVQSRVEKLIGAGVIRISAIRPGRLSKHGITVGVGISVAGPSATIAEQLASLANIDFAAVSKGVFDIITTLAGPDTDQILQTLDALRSLSNIGRLETWTHFNVVKEDYARVIGPEPAHEWRVT